MSDEVAMRVPEIPLNFENSTEVPDSAQVPDFAQVPWEPDQRLRSATPMASWTTGLLAEDRRGIAKIDLAFAGGRGVTRDLITRLDPPRHDRLL